jgi:hypothetical protein
MLQRQQMTRISSDGIEYDNSALPVHVIQLSKPNLSNIRIWNRRTVMQRTAGRICTSVMCRHSSQNLSGLHVTS